MNKNISIKPGVFIETKTPEEQLKEMIDHYNDFDYKMATPEIIRSLELIEQSIFEFVKYHRLIVKPSVSYYLKAYTW